MSHLSLTASISICMFEGIELSTHAGALYNINSEACEALEQSCLKSNGRPHCLNFKIRLQAGECA